MRIVVILVFLIVMVGGAFLVLRNMTSSDGKSGGQGGPGITQGVVAAVNIPPGGVLSDYVVMTIQNPTGLPQDVVTNPEEIRGAVVIDPVDSHKPILKSNLEKRKVKLSLLDKAEVGMRMLVVRNVTVPPSVPLIPKAKLEAVVGMQSARLASETAGETGKAMTTDAGMRPIIMTVLYAPDNKADLWEGANGADEESAGGGRDMLISAAPIDALKIGMAARENTLSVRTLSFLMASRSSGSTLAKLRSRKGISLSDINPQHNKDEKLAGELIRGLLKPEEPEMTPPPKPRQETVRWHWEYRTEEINREIEIYRGKELTKVQVPAGTRRIRVKVWDNVATAVSPPRVEPLPPVIGARG